jgi:hypothetical protein
LNDFAELTAGWETLYLLVGTAAATLMGLLFVAVSINIEKFQHENRMDLKNFGALTFNSFFYVLLIAIIFLAPGLGWTGSGILLVLIGAVDLVNAALQWRRIQRVRKDANGQRIAARFRLPMVSLSALVILSIVLTFKVQLSLYGIIVVVVSLLGSASVNAWNLLVQSEIISNNYSSENFSRTP